MRPKPPLEKMAALAAYRGTGRSVRETAKEFGVSPQTVQNWVKAHRELEAEQTSRTTAKPPGGRFRGVRPLTYEADEPGELETSEPAPETALERLARRSAEQPEVPIADDRDTLTQIKQMLRDALSQSEQAGKIGHAADAQKFGRIAAVLVPVIARLERENKQDVHVLRISRTEIAERRAKVRQRFRSLLDRPLLCSSCNRKLSVFWGTGKTEAELETA